MLDRRQFVKVATLGTASVIGSAYVGLAGCAAPAAAPAADTAASGTASEDQAPSTVTVRDLENRSVEVPTDPQNIAALLGNSTMRVTFLDAIPRVTYSMQLTETAWRKVIYPNFDDSHITYLEAQGARDPNVEELAQSNVELVYFWNDLPEVVERFEQLDIPVLCVNPSSRIFTTSEEWLDVVTDELMVYAETLGDAAGAKVADWLEYAKEKVDYVEERTKGIEDSDRPSVYYLRQTDTGLQCFAKGSAALAFVNIAGGRLVSEDLETSGGFLDVTIEEVVTWNPDVIFMGWIASKEVITENPQFSSIAAVENDRVYLNPTSLATTGWSYDAEAPLEILYLAKTLHPELFTDLDLPQEIKDFHERFRGASITLEQAQLMIDHKDPA